MFRRILPIAALTLGLSATSTLAQSVLPPGDSTAARTLEQNRRVIIGRPVPPEIGSAAAESRAPTRSPTPAAPTARTRRVDLAAGGNPGAPQ